MCPAVAWFARRATITAQDEHTKKRQRLSVDAQRWEQYRKTTDRLAQEHAQQTHDIYHRAHAAAVARQHLRTLHTCYTNTLTAKTDYHRLVTKLVEEQMCAPTFITIALSQSNLSLFTLVTQSLSNGSTPQSTFTIVAFMLLMHLNGLAFHSAPVSVSHCVPGQAVMKCIRRTSMSPRNIAAILHEIHQPTRISL